MNTELMVHTHGGAGGGEFRGYGKENEREQRNTDCMFPILNNQFHISSIRATFDFDTRTALKEIETHAAESLPLRH